MCLRTGICTIKMRKGFDALAAGFPANIGLQAGFRYFTQPARFRSKIMQADREPKRDRKAHAGTATSELGARDEPMLRRRKLLKGSLAAPVILTLYNGAALARTSNIVTTATSRDQALNGGTTAVCVNGTATGGDCSISATLGTQCDAGAGPGNFTTLNVNNSGWQIGQINEKCNAQFKASVAITNSSAMSLF
jgi:hypothetical protein